jgi:hypothetical protein
MDMKKREGEENVFGIGCEVPFFPSVSPSKDYHWVISKVAGSLGYLLWSSVFRIQGLGIDMGHDMK